MQKLGGRQVAWDSASQYSLLTGQRTVVPARKALDLVGVDGSVRVLRGEEGYA
jgi:hypothetical protein